MLKRNVYPRPIRGARKSNDEGKTGLQFQILKFHKKIVLFPAVPSPNMPVKITNSASLPSSLILSGARRMQIPKGERISSQCIVRDERCKRTQRCRIRKIQGMLRRNPSLVQKCVGPGTIEKEDSLNPRQSVQGG